MVNRNTTAQPTTNSSNSAKLPVMRSWRVPKVRIALLFAWYDLWVGLFWDKKKKWLYILPVPMLGIILKFGRHDA